VRHSARKKVTLRMGRKKVKQMKKLMTFVAVLSMTSIAWAGSGREATADRLEHAGRVIHEIMSAPDKGIPEEVLEHARCIAVVPHMLKGGFVFGAENGRGVATCRTANGWSAPAFFTITGGSWGLQIGVEGVDLVMIIQNEEGMKHLINSNFENWAATLPQQPDRLVVMLLRIPTGSSTPKSSPTRVRRVSLPGSR
jgi:lipid-binding SYLF domain-containing protein